MQSFGVQHSKVHREFTNDEVFGVELHGELRVVQEKHRPIREVLRDLAREGEERRGVIVSIEIITRVCASVVEEDLL